MNVTKTFEDYINHGISPYGAVLNTMDDIIIRTTRYGYKRGRMLAELRNCYRAFSNKNNPPRKI